MLKVEFHCHTNASKDSLTRPHDLVEACRRKGIDRVIITDHNTIRGAQAAQALDPQRVIVGEHLERPFADGLSPRRRSSLGLVMTVRF